MIRDPRDVYAELKASNDAWMFQPGDINDFSRYQKVMFERWEQQKREFKYPDRLLEVKFDELIIDYEKTKSKIFSFLSISEELHTKRFSKLNPEYSIKNVGKWRTGLTDFEKDVSRDILGETLANYNWKL